MTMLTDHQIRLLQIIDHVRWAEEDELNAYEYQLVRRAMGQRCPVVRFELEQAVKFLVANDRNPPPSPEPGPDRSPWIDTWGVPTDRAINTGY